MSTNVFVGPPSLSQGDNGEPIVVFPFSAIDEEDNFVQMNSVVVEMKFAWDWDKLCEEAMDRIASLLQDTNLTFLLLSTSA